MCRASGQLCRWRFHSHAGPFQIKFSESDVNVFKASVRRSLSSYSGSARLRCFWASKLLSRNCICNPERREPKFFPPQCLFFGGRAFGPPLCRAAPPRKCPPPKPSLTDRVHS